MKNHCFFWCKVFRKSYVVYKKICNMEIKILTDRPGVYNMVSTFETCKVTHTFLLWLMISVEIYLERKKMVAGIHGSFTLYAGEVLEVSVTPTAGRGTPPWGIFSEGKIGLCFLMHRVVVTPLEGFFGWNLQLNHP